MPKEPPAFVTPAAVRAAAGMNHIHYGHDINKRAVLSCFVEAEPLEAFNRFHVGTR
jgi:hypothetical protein